MIADFYDTFNKETDDEFKNSVVVGLYGMGNILFM